MKYFHPGVAAIRMAGNHPTMGRLALAAVAKVYIALRLSPPSLFNKIAGSIGYMVPAKATLGNGMKMRVVWNDTGGCGYGIWRAGWYEPQTVQVISDLLRPGMTFFDVGANMGQYTLMAAGLDCKVHSFEPAPVMFGFLSGNVKQVADRVKINQLGLSDNDEPVTLHMAKPHNVGSTSMRSDPTCASGESFQVACETMDHYIERNGIAQVDVIKIDVEGAELNVLKGAEKLLSSPQRPAIVLEFEEEAQRRFGSSCAQLTSFLKAHGYELQRVTPQGVIPYVPKVPDDYSFNILANPVAVAKNLSAERVGEMSAVGTNR
jgi:FkbM family methyltransferase